MSRVSEFLSGIFRARRPSEFVRPNLGTYIFRPGGSGVDWSTQVGDLHANGIVAVGLKTILDKVNQASYTSYKKSPKGWIQDDAAWSVAWSSLEGSQYSFAEIMTVVAASLKLYGMAYVVIERDLGGKPVNLVPYMSFGVRPVIINGEQFYDVTPQGSDGKVARRTPASDVIVFRDGIPDPRNPKVFISPLIAMLREIATDNEISTFMASLLRNAGVPSYMLVPKMEVKGDMKGLIAKVREQFNTYTRDRRGEPMIMPMDLDVKTIGIDPQHMQLVPIWNVTVQRILGALGVDPLVCSMPSENKTFANYEQARLALVQDTILPLLDVILLTFTEWLKSEGLWNASRGTYKLAADKSAYPELRAIIAAKVADIEKLFKAGIINRDEARQELEMPPANDKRLYPEIISEMKAAGTRAKTERARLEKLQSDV